jgi:hypothetical protein
MWSGPRRCSSGLKRERLQNVTAYVGSDKAVNGLKDETPIPY